MLKKIFIVSAVILSVLLVFFGIYNFVFKPSETAKTDEDSQGEEVLADASSENAEELTQGRIKDISGEPVIAPALNKDGNRILFYASKDGRVFSLSLEGKGRNVFASQSLEGLSDVLWSPDKNRVISQFDGGTRMYMYDYEAKKGSPLKGEIKDIAWSNLGDRIIYQYISAKANELNIADPDGSNWHKITDIRASRARVAPVPQTSLISFWNYPKAGEETGLLTVGILGGEVKKIFGGKQGADYRWSPNGKRALVSFSDSQKMPQIGLGVIDYDGSGFQDLSIPTLVSKCAWSKDGKTVYYALPSNIPDKALMPDDYLEKKFTTKDTFWRVNLENGEKKRLIELEDLNRLEQGFDAEKLFLNPQEDALFFVNRKDRHLYRLELSAS